MSEDVSRRKFVTSTAAAMVPAVLSAQSPNSELQVAWIGTGGRGYYLMERAYKGSKGFKVVATCDTYDGNLARGKDRIQTMGGNTPKTFKDYRELLADKSIDAVVIATPEHLHHPMAIAALKANKHIYLEKPVAHTIEEGFEIQHLAEKSNRVLQVGTQNRSNTLYQKAKEMIAQGMIGDIHYVRAFWYRNSAPDNPAWRYNIPPDANEQNTDWGKFLGGAKKREFHKGRYYQWRLYWDYSGGISTDLLVHQTDITNFVCGKKLPSSCVSSGGVYRWADATDDREVPDTFSALYEYPGKFHINYSCYFGNVKYGYGEQFMGNEGTIEVLNRQILTFTPENYGPRTPAAVAARKEMKIELPGNDNLAVEAHIKNWLDSIRGNAKLIAPIQVGQEAAISGHMATLSFRNNKKVLWDEKTNKHRFA